MVVDPADATCADHQDGSRGALVALVSWAHNTIVLGGRFGLTFRGDRLGRLYVAPWQGRETFFTDAIGIVHLDEPHLAEGGAAALDAFIARNGGAGLSYGHPVKVDAAGMVTPLLYSEVVVGGDAGGRTAIRKAPGCRPRLHHRPLFEAGLDRATIDEVAERIERGDFGCFAECLAELGAILGVPHGAAAFQINNVTALCNVALAPGWHGTAVLYVSPPGPARERLLDELARVEPAFSDAANPTALHALVAPRRPPAQPVTAAVVAAFPMTADLPPVLDTCLTAPLTAVEAPPGTGKAALLANLMASLMVDGQSVLYVSPSAAIIDQHATRFQAIVAKHQDWIPKLGSPGLKERLTGSFERLTAAGPAPGAGTRITRQGLADLQQKVAAVQRRIEALRQAQRDLADRRRRRQSLEREVAADWAVLLDPALDWDVDPDRVAHWRAEAERLAGGRGGGGFVRLLRRRGRQPMSLPALRQRLDEALAPLPPDLSDPILFPMSATGTDDRRAAGSLAAGFDQMARVVDCRRAGHAERNAAEAIAAAPTAERLGQELALAQSRAGQAARELLRDTWQAAVTTATDAGDKLAAVYDRMEERRRAGGHWNGGADADLGRLISPLTRPCPLWTVQADMVPHLVPLVDGLFDMVIVDDADRISGATLLGLLLRGRRAVVLGSLAEPGTARTDAFTLAASAIGARPHALAVQSRSHPDIVRYLSEVFHDGVLRPQPGPGTLREELPGTAAGLHWHQPPPGTGSAEAAEVDGLMRLLRGWQDHGVVGNGARRSVGVTTPVPERCDALRHAVAAALGPAMPGEQVVVGVPDRFFNQIVDLLVILPGIGDATPPQRSQRLAASRALYHEAVAAARLGVHVVGDARSCRSAGGHAAALLRHCRPPTGRNAPAGAGPAGTAGDPCARLGTLLDQAGLFCTATPEGYRALGRFGGTYDVRLAGRPDHSAADPSGHDDPDQPILVIVQEDDLAHAPQLVSRRLERLV